MAPTPPAVASAALATVTGNRSYPWDYFDPASYAEENYKELYEDDRRILQMVRDYFEKVGHTVDPESEGVDVGAGANLYPGMSMLPFCRTITLFERSLPNRIWLHEQRDGYSADWDPYWDVLASKQPYYDILDPRETFKQRIRVRRGDIFEPPAREKWDMGTMFFVAESITQQQREFKTAVANFVGLLNAGAPFAAAFMQGSRGYRVGGIDFPAVPIGKVDVEHQLGPIVEELNVTSVRSTKPLRDGYQGMILAVGRAGRSKR
jgi:hypothetical protein